MISETKEVSVAIRLAYLLEGKEAGHVRLYLIRNDKHRRPYGLVEDLFVEEVFRGKGVATSLMRSLMTRAMGENCYKLIANSRRENEHVHKLYKKLGFLPHGYEFRINI